MSPSFGCPQVFRAIADDCKEQETFDNLTGYLNYVQNEVFQKDVSSTSQYVSGKPIFDISVVPDYVPGYLNYVQLKFLLCFGYTPLHEVFLWVGFWCTTSSKIGTMYIVIVISVLGTLPCTKLFINKSILPIETDDQVYLIGSEFEMLHENIIWNVGFCSFLRLTGYLNYVQKLGAEVNSRNLK